MSTRVHTVKAGDTFDLISSRYFGEPSHAAAIRSSNSGVVGTLIPGTKILVSGVDDPPDTIDESEGLLVRIGGTTFQHIKSITIRHSIDQLDTISITCPLADTPEFRELIKPFSFASFDVSDRGERLFRGTLVGVSPEVSSEGSTVKLSGYSLPGALNDCMMPPSSYPLQFRKMNLFDIAKKLCEPFGIKVVRVGDIGGVFKKVKMKRDKTVMSFLIGLARQRQILIRSNAAGELVLAEPPTVKAAVSKLHEDLPPVKVVKSEFRAQRYYSHTTCVRRTSRGKVGGQHTILNQPAIDAGILRPLVKSLRDVTRSELPKATTAAAGRMLAGSVSYDVQIATWRDANGDRWVAGDTIELQAPSVFVPDPYQFQIRSVEFKRSPAGELATLSLMLPGAFGGQSPSMLPWQ